LTPARGASIDDAVKRLELAGVRICQRCGRGRADLTASDGTTLAVPVDAARARELSSPAAGGDAPWLSSLVVTLLRAQRFTLREVVLDAAEQGLRALVTLARGDDNEVVTCTPQEGVGLAVRAKVPLYATAEALATTTAAPTDGGGETLH
jgi:bifunctional DNase/RNase